MMNSSSCPPYRPPYTCTTFKEGRTGTCMALPEPYAPSDPTAGAFAGYRDAPPLPEPEAYDPYEAYDPHPPLAPPDPDLDPKCTWILSIDVGHKNLGMCAIEPGPDPQGRDDRIRFWTVTSTLPGAYAVVDTMKKAGVMDILPLIRHVAIERQVGRNCAAVRLQNYLEMFFAMHDKLVMLQDSCHKLTFAAGSPYWPNKVPENWSYHTRKKVSIMATRTYLETTPQSESARGIFLRSSKLDDLADSLLQGLAFIHFVAPQHHPKAQAKRSQVPAPRRPNEKQLASGKLVKAHAVFLILQNPTSLDSYQAFEKVADAFKPLRRALIKHFGSMDNAFTVLKSTPPPDPKAPKQPKLSNTKAKATAKNKHAAQIAAGPSSGANAIDLGPPRRPPAPLSLGHPETHAHEQTGVQDRRVRWSDQSRPGPSDHGVTHQSRT